MSDSQGTEAARRVADVLVELGAAAGPVGVNDLARRIGISPTVAHRILQALMTRDLVAQDDPSQKYVLGVAALQLGGSALVRVELQRSARPVLERLVARTGLTATLSVLTGTRRMYLDQVLPPTELRLSVELGVPYPLTQGSTGRAILAQLPEAMTERLIAGDMTGDGAADPELDSAFEAARTRLRSQLREVRTNGFAVARGERIEGAVGAARAFGLSTQAVLGAVNIIGPLGVFRDDRIDVYRDALTEACSAVDELLVGSPTPR